MKQRISINLNMNCFFEVPKILKENKNNKKRVTSKKVSDVRLPVDRMESAKERTIPSVLKMRIVYIAVSVQRMAKTRLVLK